MRARPSRKKPAASRARSGATPRKAPRRDAGRARGGPILEAVLNATVAELAEHGLDGLSVDRIARAAEVNKTSVYRRWPTREALVAAAMERVVDDVDVRLGAAPPGTLRQQLFTAASTVAGFLSTPGGRALAIAAVSSAGAPELAAMARRRLEQGTVGALANVVAGAMQRGEWRRNLDPVPVLGMLAGAILHRTLMERRPADDAWLRLVVDVLVRGVAPG